MDTGLTQGMGQQSTSFGAIVGTELGRTAALACALGFGLPALFLFAHPYWGVRHDGHLYALQALSLLEPAALRGDLFFRFGSQDNFTIFSRFYALLINLLGLESAAWLVTRTAGVALVAAAMLLARRLMDRQLSWLALALFVLVIGHYGGRSMFSYGEDFATSRTLSEALTLAAVGATVLGRIAVPWLLLGLAATLHPLMALPGLLFAIAWKLSPRQLMWAAALAALVLGACVAIGAVAPMGPLRFIDPEWRAVLEWNSPYLFTYEWALVDWQQAALPLITLAMAVALLPTGNARRAAGLALAIGIAGTLLSILASYFSLALLVQGQPWRWTWLARAMAILLVAPVSIALWNRGPVARGAFALFATAWLAANEIVGLPAILLALLFTVLAHARPHDTTALRGLPWVLALLLLGALLNIDGFPYATPAVAASVAGWWLLFRAARPSIHAAVATAAIAFCAVQVSHAATRPSLLDYGDAAFRAFAPWRAAIRPDQTVIYNREQFLPWLLLHRRTFTPELPTLFSRDSALAVRDRYRFLTAAGAWEPWIKAADGQYREPIVTPEMFRKLCSRPDIDFVITPDPLPAPYLPSSAPAPRDKLRLYSCAGARTAESP